METAITVLGITTLTLVVFSLWLGWLYVSKQKIHAAEREALIKEHYSNREELEKNFADERLNWLNKVLKVNGFSSIKGDQQKSEPKIHIVESTLNRNARLKREQTKPASEVNNA